jgi:hypothetical protein
MPIALLIDSTKMLLESPRTCHMAKPFKPFAWMNLPFAAGYMGLRKFEM